MLDNGNNFKHVVRMMKHRLIWGLVALLLMNKPSLSAERLKASPRQIITVTELMHAEVIGQLKKPLGTIVVISGRYNIDGENKDKLVEMEIESVDEKPLDKVVSYDLQHWSEGWKGRANLKNGERFRLIGVELGTFAGDIVGIQKYEPSIKNLQGRVESFGFHPWFYVLASSPIDASPSAAKAAIQK